MYSIRAVIGLVAGLTFLCLSVPSRAAWITYEITLTPNDINNPESFTGTFEVDPAHIPRGICGGCNGIGLRQLTLLYDGINLSTNFLPLVTLSLDDAELGGRYLTGVSGAFPFPWNSSGENLELFFGNVDGEVIDRLDPPSLTYRWNCREKAGGDVCISDGYSTGTYTLTGPPLAAAPEPSSLALLLLGLWATRAVRASESMGSDSNGTYLRYKIMN